MKTGAFLILVWGGILFSGVIWAEDDTEQRDATAQLRQTIAEEAYYIRQLNNDHTLTPQQRKAMIDLRIQKKNEDMAKQRQ